ncbi:MAG TPA: ferritin [Calditrichia bacterium]|nr:ferritin [Calditrichia bacterium]
MMLSEKITTALNQQIAMEAYAANYYLAMASWCDQQGLEGSAGFFYAQAEEEREHMMKIFHFVNDADGKAIAPAIAQPPSDFESLAAICKTALGHEQKVTAAIHAIQKQAMSEGDYRTINLMNWFVDEQLEEENQMQGIMDKLKLIGNDGTGLYMLDKELGAKAAAKAAGEED